MSTKNKHKNTSLRDLTEQDLGALLRWRNDRVVNKYLTNRIQTEEAAQAWYNRIRKDENNRLKAIVSAEYLVGYAIVEDVDLTTRKCEIGVIVGEPEYWGAGFGQFAVGELLDECFRKMNLHRVLAVIAEGNDRSRRLFAGMGFVHEGTLRDATVIQGIHRDLLCYAIIESEFKP